jgi:serine/threonine protein kinase
MLNMGQTLGEYTVASGQLGSNNQFGEVYKARKQDGSHSALKVCIRVDQKDRFIQENDILHDLSGHAGIITPHTRVIEHAQLKLSYYCMELADQNIAEYIIQNPNTAFDNLKGIFLQICDAIKYAHDQDIVHRDLHHGNVLIMLSTPVKTKLTDFGKAKRFDAPLATSYPAGTEWGRTDTIAPEVFFKIWSKADLKNYAKSSDIYSLGIILAFLFGIAADSYLYRLFFGQGGIQPFFVTESIGTPGQLPKLRSGIDIQDRIDFYNKWLASYDYRQNLPNLLTMQANASRTSSTNAVIAKCCDPNYRNRYSIVDDIMNDMRSVA